MGKKLPVRRVGEIEAVLIVVETGLGKGVRIPEWRILGHGDTQVLNHQGIDAGGRQKDVHGFSAKRIGGGLRPRGQRQKNGGDYGQEDRRISMHGAYLAVKGIAAVEPHSDRVKSRNLT